MGIGKIVRQLRKERGWKLEELSRRSGVAVGTISAIEVRDSVRSEYASQLAHGLGVPVSVLLGSPTNPTPPALVGGSAAPATIGQTLEALAAKLSALDAGTRETVAGLIHEAICKPDKAPANIAAIEALVRFATGRVETAAIAQAPAKT